MKITNARFKKFSELKKGEFFRRNCSGLIYLKTKAVKDDLYENLNALSLYNNNFDIIDVAELVEPLDCELVIQ